MMRALIVGLLTLLSINRSINASPYPDYHNYAGRPYQVTYDKRSFIFTSIGQSNNQSIDQSIDQSNAQSERVLFFGGSIHYPRFSEGMWRDVLTAAKKDGVNLITTYVFWSGHEPVEGEFIWSGRYNITHFLEEAARAGLFVNLRVGPFVCGEYNLGAIPVWLQFNRPGIRYRAYDDRWMGAIQKWTTILIDRVRPYFSDRGGPIISAQIENELVNSDQRYVQWNGDFAQSLQVNVPWMMCNGQCANNTINACNADDCTDFISYHGQNGRILIDQPFLWTEMEQWFSSWGDPSYPLLPVGHNRTSEDVAFVSLRYFARGGVSANYYMYFGGNHYGNTAGGGVATAYADGANHHADTLPNEPRLTHMNKVHEIVARVASDLLKYNAQADTPVALMWRIDPSHPWANGTGQKAFEYGSTVFVENYGSVFLQTLYKDVIYDMPGDTILVLINGKQIFNSSNVELVPNYRSYNRAIKKDVEWTYWSEAPFLITKSMQSSKSKIKQSIDQSIQLLDNSIPITLTSRPMEQLNMTRDLTDFLWYSTSINVGTIKDAKLYVNGSIAGAIQVFIDGVRVGACYDYTHAAWSDPALITCSIGDIQQGVHILSMLYTALGNQNDLDADEDPLINHQQGVRRGGNVTINGVDITNQIWAHRPYVVGQWLEIYDKQYESSVPWTVVDQSINVDQPITWFKTRFSPLTIPSDGPFSVLLDIQGLNRGRAWVNGHDIGRYWAVEGQGTGQPTQRYYHIPNDWLNWENENELVLFEELGATELKSVMIYTSQIVYGKWGPDAKIASE